MKRLLNRVFSWKKHVQPLIVAIVLMILATQLIALPANATGVYQMPKVSAGDRTWVIDQAEVLSRINESKLSTELEKLSNQTGNEVRMVTIRRLDYGETIATFTRQLFEKWYPTTADQANQTLLVIDTQTNNSAIQTGDKVKSLLPDEIAESVAQETVLVPLKEGEKYNQAFLDASDRLMAVLSGQPDPGPPQIAENVAIEGTFKKAEETDAGNATIWVIGFLLAATIIPMATYYLYVK